MRQGVQRRTYPQWLTVSKEIPRVIILHILLDVEALKGLEFHTSNEEVILYDSKKQNDYPGD